MSEVVRPRADTYSATCHQWLTIGSSARRTLPTTWVHMCTVSRVSAHGDDARSGQVASSAAVPPLMPPIVPVPARPIRRSRRSRATAAGRRRADRPGPPTKVDYFSPWCPRRAPPQAEGRSRPARGRPHPRKESPLARRSLIAAAGLSLALAGLALPSPAVAGPDSGAPAGAGVVVETAGEGTGLW